MYRNKKLIFVFLAALLLVFGYYIQEGEKVTELDSKNNLQVLETGSFPQNASAEPADKSIVVHLAGAVKNAGVYKLDKNDRLVDLIKAAGGLTENADLTKLNLAEKLFDGQKLIVADKSKNNDFEKIGNSNIESTEEIVIGNYSNSKHSSLININQASQSQLEELSGIGPSKAAAIIKYRDENSYFSSKEDLLKISGIGEKTLENIRNEIVLQ
ncbi:competence protein ComEA [Halanaerobium saccharolyticum]|jgi:competence protein ComEA|uniref:Competence protein ComEA n=1 Tax=Halanaerobium saccharolyticum TaxID=43595 RepID=A0A2T5RNN8_9FIRM|nr:helix-hairpin-helix domain-containing protein [Halanaerobium saccharolyticum]PTW01287.1 competence protein ComEA [Halanaerobium saccharolyticum]